MSFIFKNISIASISVVIEPSTDELLLKAGDTLMVMPKFDKTEAFEFHLEEGELTIWLPHGQSANLYINGDEIESHCSKYIW